MKTPNSFSIIRSITAALLCAGVFSSAAQAALIAAWDVQNAPGVVIDPTPPPWDWAEGVTVSDMTLHGSIVGTQSGSPMIYRGFPSSISFTDYVGFTVAPDARFQVTLTDLIYLSPDNVGGKYSWGYRVGGGEWSIFTGERSSTRGANTFVFAEPIVTTEAVEFGYFASAPTAGTEAGLTLNGNNRNDIQLNGTVAAVPEPATYGLILGAGSVALVLARRRKATANNS